MKNILVKPLITEKSMQSVAKNKYNFKVNKNANKAQIKNEVKKQYGVDAINIKTNIVKGRIKNYRGKKAGRTKDYKKAVITLPKGQKIADFSIKS